MTDQPKVNNQEVLSATAVDVQSAPGEARSCHNYWCNYKTHEPLSLCPECGRHLLTAQTYRLLGLALVFLGGILALAGALLLILAAPRLVGGVGVKLFVWSIFGLLLAVGLMFVTAGFWQVVSGRRSQSLMTMVIALVITLMLIVGIGRAVL